MFYSYKLEVKAFSFFFSLAVKSWGFFSLPIEKRWKKRESFGGKMGRDGMFCLG